jgi:hypothetical protein
MKNYSDFLNLLDSLTSVDLENILNDYNLVKSKGCKIFYVVDTYDLINYALPFIDSDVTSKNKNDYSQHTIAYETVFANREAFNFSLLDEYKEELISINNNISFKLKNFAKIKEQFFSLILDDKSGEEQKSDKLFIRDNLESFVAMYIFLEHGTNIYDRFNNLIKEKLNIESFKSKDLKIDKLINSLFKEKRRSSLTNKIFDIFVDKNSLRLSSLNSEYDKYCYLENTYRDISVIDRVINVNKLLKEHKIIFHYLSSAPRKTNQIFDIVSSLEDNHSKINRNIMQLYLLNFFNNLDLKGAEISFFIKSLIDLKNISAKNNDDSDYSIKNPAIIPFANILIAKMRNDKTRLESTFFFKTYFDYREKFEKIIEKGSRRNVELVQYLNDFDKKLKTELSTNKIPVLPIEVDCIQQAYSLKKKMFKKDVENTIKIPIGSDIIRNSFQHLPVLVCSDDEQNNLYDFFNQITNFPHNEPIEIYDIGESIGRVLNTNVSSDVQYIILTFLNLIIHQKDSDLCFSEKLVIENLEKYKKLKSKSSIFYTLDENSNKIIYSFSSNEKLEKEVDYLLLWFYRRNRLFEKTHKLIKKYEKSEDPRFFHGIGLVYIAEAYDLHDRGDCKQANEKFNAANKKLESAYQKYIEKEEKTHPISLKQLLTKQKISVLNTLICSKLMLLKSNNIESVKNNEVLFELRNYMDIMKYEVKTKLHNINYNKYVTFIHTEAKLEYYEALYLFENKKYTEALNKISHSTKKAYYFENSSYLTKDRFEEILKQTASLRMKIFKALNYI